MTSETIITNNLDRFPLSGKIYQRQFHALPYGCVVTVSWVVDALGQLAAEPSVGVQPCTENAE